MEWKESDEDGIQESDGGDLSFDGNPFSEKKDEEDSDLRPNLFKKNMTPIIVIGAGALLLILLVFVIFSGPRNDTDNSRYAAFDARLKQLENRMTALEAGDRQTAEEVKRLESLVQAKTKRLDVLETSIAKKMNELAQEQETLKMRPVPPPPPKPAPPRKAEPPAKSSQARYHVVRAGENLYRIGLRYHMKVSDLRRLNHLGPDEGIHPGQKLLVAPANGR